MEKINKESENKDKNKKNIQNNLTCLLNKDKEILYNNIYNDILEGIPIRKNKIENLDEL
jgi:hypothetical protein